MLLFFLSFFGAGVGGEGGTSESDFLTKNPNLKKKKKKKILFFFFFFFFCFGGGGWRGG